MDKFNCLIVEDEPLAAEVMEDYVKQVPFLQLKGTCSDAIYAMDMLKKEKIDVIFLDIHLPRIKGNDFIKSLKNPPQIIMTTAYRDYAIESYELNVLDYLVKPISFNRFLMTVNKLKMRSQKETAGTNDSGKKRPFLFFNVSKKRVKIYLEDILYIESVKEYLRISTREKSILTKFQMGEIEELLAENNFLRVHRSFIVSKDKIDAYTATDVEIGDKQIPIGRSYKETVLSVLGGSQ